jgi:hypothetical protein
MRCDAMTKDMIPAGTMSSIFRDEPLTSETLGCGNAISRTGYLWFYDEDIAFYEWG